MNNTLAKKHGVIAIVPAAGVGKRMKANCPKQYLHIQGKTVLEHTVDKLLACPSIEHVIIAVSDSDEYYADTALVSNERVTRVSGGAERVDSVLAGLKSDKAAGYYWALVHDAARPCVDNADIDNLIQSCLASGTGGLLAYPVRDTMKRAQPSSDKSSLGKPSPDNGELVANTVDRAHMWHALTPQMYPIKLLINAIESGLTQGITITDESSAIEAFGEQSKLIEARSDNIKITRPDDLALSRVILSEQLSTLSAQSADNSYSTNKQDNSCV